MKLGCSLCAHVQKLAIVSLCRLALPTTVLLTGLLLNGCANVPHASSADDSAAKTFRIKPNVANLYIYRESGLLGAAVGWDVLLDGRTVGVLTSGSYIFSEVQPGQHMLSRLQTAKRVRLEPGRNYFFRIAPSIAASESKFVEVSEQEGRSAVSKLPRLITFY